MSVDTAAPYEFVVSGFTAPGTRSFTARAVDIAGNSADSGVVKLTVNDAGSPVIQSFKANPNPVEVLSTVELEVSATDDVKVTEVQILEGTQVLKTFTAAPFKFSLTMNDLNTRTFSAVVKDASGNAARAELSIKAEDNVAPSVTLTPSVTLENARVVKGSSLSFTTTANDNFALEKLELFVNGNLLSSVSNAPFNINTVVNTSSLGSREVKAVATDQAGKTSEVVVALEVVNPVVQLAAGSQHTCALFANGEVRCWGANGSGQLGIDSTVAVNDAKNTSPVLLGQPAKQITAGGTHNCALLVDGTVKCWGNNDSGQLGYGDILKRGAAAGDMAGLQALKGIKAKQITAGLQHTCALLEAGTVFCWGNGLQGKLGYGINSADNILTPTNAPSSVNILGNANATILEVRAGNQHTCALLSTQNMRCWGVGLSGALGYASTANIGLNEPPSSAGDVNLGQNVVPPLGLGSTASHTCVVLASKNVSCWGKGGFGQLGYGNVNDVGDNETPLSAGIVNVGGTAVHSVVTGGSHTCALLETGAVRCWGLNFSGQLGYGNTNNIGDDLNDFPLKGVSITPDNALKVTQLVAGQNHTCALLENGGVKCWGAARKDNSDTGRITMKQFPPILVTILPDSPRALVSSPSSEVIMSNAFPATKNSEYLKLAQQSFCERFGVNAPHEAIDRRLATITEWCIHLGTYRATQPTTPRANPSPSDDDGLNA
ncbi:MAG: hypothetical protein HC933_05790 [Pleurocapsa sp. SU_196_0]|nr:hypothetical protein [Pleurocapsa sp. SU_196_0]